jgi:hypothetical protein
VCAPAVHSSKAIILIVSRSSNYAGAATVPPDLARHADFSLLAHGTGHHAHPTAAAVFVAKQVLLE